MNDYTEHEGRKYDRSTLRVQVSTTVLALAMLGGLMAYGPGSIDTAPAAPPQAATSTEPFVYFPSQYELNAREPEELPAQF